MMGVEAHPVDEVVGEDASFVVGGFLPDLVDVEVAEVAGDVLEGLGDLVAVVELALQLGGPGFEAVDLGGKFGFLFGEEVGADGSSAGAAWPDSPGAAVVRLIVSDEN